MSRLMTIRHRWARATTWSDAVNCRTSHQISKTVFLISLTLFFVSYFYSDDLPAPPSLTRQIYSPPVQGDTEAKDFIKEIFGQKYFITPRAKYELTGLVVSLNDLDEAWFNIDYDDDPYNMKDICVIWGGNLVSGDYRKVEFWSGLWTCYFRFNDDVSFNPHELSNNHLLPGDMAVAARIEGVEVGDQMRLRGFLVDYELNGMMRATSLTRNDTGNHACEVVYVTDFEVFKRANVAWRVVRDTTKWLMLFAVLATAVSYFLY